MFANVPLRAKLIPSPIPTQMAVLAPLQISISPMTHQRSN